MSFSKANSRDVQNAIDSLPADVKEFVANTETHGDLTMAVVMLSS